MENWSVAVLERNARSHLFLNPLLEYSKTPVPQPSSGEIS